MSRDRITLRGVSAQGRGGSDGYGRKNWLFCWTEVGAKYVGIFQSLIVTCKMHGIDPHTYLVDVLQRVADHPRSDIVSLPPLLWKTRFADDPLRSDLHILTKFR